MKSTRLVNLDSASVVGNTAHLPARNGQVQIDASTPRTMTQCKIAEIPIGRAGTSAGQIAIAVATKLN